MTTPFTNDLALKVALAQVIRELLPDKKRTTVSWGIPGPSFRDEIVALMETESDQVMATMGGRRTREETIVQTVTFTVVKQGSDDSALMAANVRAIEMLGLLEYHCRITDTTLGGVVRQCFMTSHSGDEVLIPQRNQGRTYQVEAVFTAQARISGSI